MRFPEFSGEWEKNNLSKFSSKITKKNKSNFINNVLCNSANLGIIPQNDYFDRDIANADNTDSYYIIEQGDFVYNPRKSTAAPYGPVNIYNGEKPGIISPLYLCFSVFNISPSFLFYRFKSSVWHPYVYSHGDTGVRYDRVSIKDDVFFDMPIYTPTQNEQEKIATLLSLIDERIATQNKIIEDLKKLKSAISKQAFAQKPNGWNRLDTLFSKGKAGGTPTSTNKEYYNGEIPFLSINDITKQGKYVRYTENHLSRSGLENSSAWVVPEYSLIISMYASVGLVTINEVPITTSQAMFAMQLRDKDLLDYLYYYLSYFKYRHIHKYLETGTQSNINADIVRGIMIPTYGHSRNMKIASTLQGIDAKIDNELSVLKLFNRQKNYLLSQMFI